MEIRQSHHNGYYYPAVGAVIGAVVGLAFTLIDNDNVAWGIVLGGAAGIVVMLIVKTLFHWR